MTELEIPPHLDQQQVAELVDEHVDVGDEVQIWEAERTGGDAPERTGTVTGIEPGYLELDDEPLEGPSVRYDEIKTVIRVNAE